jgi:hypothetical protein
MIDKIKKVMHEFKSGELHSGSKVGPIVRSRKQAVAIALNEKRHEKADHSWKAWGQKKDRFKKTGSTIKGEALNKIIVGKGRSRISGNTYSHE